MSQNGQDPQHSREKPRRKKKARSVESKVAAHVAAWEITRSRADNHSLNKEVGCQLGVSACLKCNYSPSSAVNLGCFDHHRAVPSLAIEIAGW